VSAARYWHSEGETGEIVCELCPRACRIVPGGSGVCHVRANRGGEMVLPAWGRGSGFCIDPVEKKPLYHFLPGSPILSFGAVGCNLACEFCQNWRISRARPEALRGPEIPPDEIAYAAVRKGCRSVAATYNEPIVALEYAVEVAAACHAQQVRAVAVTAGYIAAAARAEFFTAFDAVNVDLKAFTEDFYARYCHGRLAPVREALSFIARETGTWLEVTTLLIPGLNDSDAEIAALSAWIAAELSPDVPLHLSAFHPDHKMPHIPPTPPETLTRARARAQAEGLRYVYTGNVRDEVGETTVCPGCGQAVIRRDRYEIRDYGLDAGGRCAACGARIPGVFDGWPGDWGRRCVPVDLPIRRNCCC
jgi:pyruvate formate lyase activating enzyme